MRWRITSAFAFRHAAYCFTRSRTAGSRGAIASFHSFDVRPASWRWMTTRSLPAATCSGVITLALRIASAASAPLLSTWIMPAPPKRRMARLTFSVPSSIAANFSTRSAKTSSADRILPCASFTLTPSRRNACACSPDPFAAAPMERLRKVSAKPASSTVSPSSLKAAVTRCRASAVTPADCESPFTVSAYSAVFFTFSTNCAPTSSSVSTSFSPAARSAPIAMSPRLKAASSTLRPSVTSSSRMVI